MWIGKLAAALAAMAAGTAATAGPSEQEWTQAPGYYRMMLGDFRVTVVSDGSVARDLPPLMSDPDLVRSRYTDQHQSLPAELSVNCFVIDTGEHRILVDTGAGELFGPGVAGQLIRNLAAAGYRPEDIDVILLTHIHGDHSGGLSIAGRRLFPLATVYVDAADPAYWLDERAEARAPEARRATFEQSRRTVGPYVATGQLQTFNAPAELFPGVTAIPLRGHTPGQSGYIFESKGKRLLLWGDIVHATEVQFEHPFVTIAYDVDPDAAARSRTAILGQAAKSGILIGASHMSFPGLGHVARRSDGYAWIPLPWRSKP